MIERDPTEQITGNQICIRQVVPDRLRVIVLEGQDQGREAEMNSARFTLGTEEGSDLVLTDPSVSRRHAELVRTENGLSLRDLGSTNGTFLGPQQIKEAFVATGARVRLGRTTLLLAPGEDMLLATPTLETSFGALHGSTPAMRRLFAILSRVAATDITLLITGETGTGKELAARAVQEHSLRASGPFAPLDCGALDRELAGSDLFGHEPGAFTGAAGRRPGIFEQARGGTVFLDEIGELPLELQPKLLRVLEQREVRRLGAGSYTPVDIRLVAATHRDLEEMVARGEFRADLFYRIAQVQVTLPPLRERLEDMPLLCDRLVARAREAKLAPASLQGVSAPALSALTSVAWKGNVRELRNVIDRAAALCTGDWITPADLMLLAREEALPRGTPALQGRTLDSIEKEAIQATLALCNGNKTRAAGMLDIRTGTLRDKMKRYGIDG